MPLPAGLIMLWRSSLGSIPDGWTLCDGTLGTPDLRDRFVVGAGDNYNPNDTGGSADHQHTFTTDGHNHTFQPGTGMLAGGDFRNLTTINTDSGISSTEDHIPPYYALAYIMLL